MFKDNNYKFECSISVDAYKTKDEVTSCITSRQLAKSYGYKEKMNFIRKTVTSNELLNSCINGSSFCHLFNGYQNIKEFNKTYQYKATGGFSLSAKSDKFFEGSFVIGVDIDDTTFESPELYIKNLSLKPTFYHTTFSNYQLDKDGNNKGLRFRLVYVFDEKIKNKFFFRYVASEINNMISTSIGTTEGIDTANLKCSQYYNGTNINNKELICNYGISNLIYSFKDFDINKISFKNFLINELKTRKLNNIDKNSINNILYYIDNNTTDNTRTNERTTLNVKTENETTPYNAEKTKLSFNDRLLNDWDRLSEEEFMKTSTDWNKLLRNTRYIYRVEKSEWINGLYQKVDNDYFSLFYYVNIVKDGSKRRKTLFQRMCLRRLINTNITVDEMVLSTIIDIIRFFDNSDKVLNSDFIKRNVERAFAMELNEIRELYSNSISYLMNKTKPKRGIIYYNKAAHSKETTFKILDEYYNKNLSVKENLDIINNVYQFKIGKTIMYEYCKENNINTNPNKVVISDDEILSLIDLTLSANKNLQLLKDSDIKLDKRRLLKLYKYKKENQQQHKVQHSYSICPNETTLLSAKTNMIFVNTTKETIIDKDNTYNGTKIQSTDNHTTLYSISDKSKNVPQYIVI